MRHPELPVFAFLTAFLVLVPLPWHWRARNISTLAIIFWLFVVDFIFGVNAIVWAGNVKITALVWCDITTKITVGASYALPLSTLCICKHLEMVSSSRKVHYDATDRRKRIIFESVTCFGLPMMFMALHYVVQGHRFDVFEDTGCQAALYISIPAVLIVWFPQLLFSVIAFIYAAMALHHFMRRRLTFATHLQNSNPALTTNRYLRLIAMAVTEMLWGTALTTFNLYNNVYPGLRPWTTWSDVHSNFSRVDIYPTITIPPQFLRIMMLFWWTLPVSSVIFFVFFGFGEEAMKEYRKVWFFFRTTILRRPPHSKFKATSKLSTPGSSAIRPLHLVDLKNPTHQPNARSTFSSLLSSPYTPTTLAPSLKKLEEAEENTDAFSISSFSYYEHSMSSPTESIPHPTLSDSSYHSSQSISSHHPYPEAVRDSIDPETLPSPGYHRPFSPPSVYPLSAPHPPNEPGVLVTIHRQASFDSI